MTTAYTYDNIGQLLSESFPGYSGSYTYDSNGNRLSRTVNGSTENYTYDFGDKLRSVTVGSTTEKSYTYDAAGRTSTVTSAAGTTQLSYDFEDRIIGITMPGRTNSMSYNAFDARVSKVDSTGTKTYLRDGEEPVDDVLSDGSLTYNPGISSHSSAGTKFEHQDYLGTNKVETDSSQNVAGSRNYDAFGNPTSSTGSPQGPFGFAGNWGYQEDPDSGLKLLGHRYYDSSTGRFLTRHAMKAGSNWYSYTRNNGTGSVDPFGWDPLNAEQKTRVQAEINELRRDGQGEAADRLQKKLDQGKITYGGNSPTSKHLQTNAKTNQDGSVILYSSFFGSYTYFEQTSILLHESVHIRQFALGFVRYHGEQATNRYFEEDEAYSAELEFLTWCLAHHKIDKRSRKQFYNFVLDQVAMRDKEGYGWRPH